MRQLLSVPVTIGRRFYRPNSAQATCSHGCKKTKVTASAVDAIQWLFIDLDIIESVIRLVTGFNECLRAV